MIEQVCGWEKTSRRTRWQEYEFLDHIEKEVTDRAFGFIEDGLDILFEMVSDMSTGYDYEGNSPYLNVATDDFDRDKIAELIRKIRATN